MADCPCAVKSMMTSQRASGSGVNCPCAVSVTIQSSISPVITIKQIFAFIYLTRYKIDCDANFSHKSTPLSILRLIEIREIRFFFEI